MKVQNNAIAKNQRGALLLEVMVAGMLLVIGVTGLGAAQMAALQTVSHSDTATRLLLLHASVFDRLRLHRNAAARGDLDLEIPHHGSVDEIAAGIPRFHDLPTLLRYGDVPIYLKVRCADIAEAGCEVCAGTFSAAEDRGRLEASAPPVNALCSTQRII